MVRKTDQVRGLSVSVVHCDEPLDLFPFLPALLSSLDQDLLLVSNPALRHVFALQSHIDVPSDTSLTCQTWPWESSYESAIKRSPSTVLWPGIEPTVSQTWFVSGTCSYPVPLGTRFEHVPLSVWNSLGVSPSNAYGTGCPDISTGKSFYWQSLTLMYEIHFNNRRFRDCISGVEDKHEQYDTSNCLCRHWISESRCHTAEPCLHDQHHGKEK